MKVTVKDNFLNVRIGRPSLNAECHQFLAPGSMIDVDGKLYKGDSFHDINTWYKDDAGNYYWSGGVNSGDVKFNYNTLLGLPAPICATKGEGVIVAIIDSGCYDHRSLNGSIIASYDVFLKQEDVHKDESLDGHGTFISGIIGAREDDGNEIVGVAPLVKIISVKAVVNSVFAENVLAALQWILTLGKDRQPNIINLSLDFDPKELIDDLEKALKACTDKGMVIVAAGQNEQEVYLSNIFYPARSIFVSGVGALSKVNVLAADQINAAIDFVVPNLSLYSTTNFNNKYRNLEGCSISSALVSGVLALFFSFTAKSPGSGSLSAVINQNIGTFNPGTFDNTLKISKK